MPVNWVTFFDALRFANWMNNGQGNGDTESGAYTLLGSTPTPTNRITITRNAGVAIALTSESEWYKAAYYDAAAASYRNYPTGTDTPTTCAAPNAAANEANCQNGAGGLVAVGSYTGSASPYGTFDQGGNALEWTEGMRNTGTLICGVENYGICRSMRGGGFSDPSRGLAARARQSVFPSGASAGDGFRLAFIPEPGTGLLVIAGLLGLAGWRRARA